ncbi:MAG: tail fiber domain-containing protein [Planctomycetota bacterium]
MSRNVALLIAFVLVAVQPIVSYAQIGTFDAIDLRQNTTIFPPRISFNEGGTQFSLMGMGTDVRMFTGANINSPMFAVDVDTAPDTLMLDEYGVGIGTALPEEMVHVYSNGLDHDLARMLIENAHTSRQNRTMLKLVNNGGSRMTWLNTATSESWSMLTNSVDNFVISRSDTDGAELMLRKDGGFIVGPGPVNNMILAPNGNLTIQGTLYEQSDRNAKCNFSAVDAEEILRRVAGMPISTWQYKDDPHTVRHIGPMAQDFHAAFSLGQNDVSIASVDASGVALASIQALNVKCEKLEEEIRSRDDRITELEDRLLALEAMVAPVSNY